LRYVELNQKDYFPVKVLIIIKYRVFLCWSDGLINDKTAEKFAKYMKKYPNLYKFLACIVQKHMINAHPIIIDLGVGPGLLSLELHKKIPNAKIIGVDPLQKMLQLANENACFDTFEALLGSSEEIPVEDDSADIVVSRFSLPYWKDPNSSFTEIYRVLKPGGRIILEALNRDFPVWRLFLIKLHMLINSAGGDVTKYHLDAYKTAYAIGQVEQFLTDANFHIIEREGNKKDWKFLVVAEK